jgi:acrylyl-CoA reductase (NADPH)
MNKFRAFRIHQESGAVLAKYESLCLDDLSPGEVVIRAKYSSMNFKDALAATGKGKILRRFPLVGGIDVAGVIDSSLDNRFSTGDKVLVTGCGLSETHDGGYAEFVRVPAEWVIPMPENFSLLDVMTIGTAGFAAALAVQRMLDNGQTPGMGPIVVTGATGGVGNITIDILNSAGFNVVAITGKQEAIPRLKDLGASQVVLRQDITLGDQPLEKGQWGGAIDTVGGEFLAWLTRTVKPWGNIASIGMAGGIELNTTVMPFILRGVSLLGASSANCPIPLRHRIWQRLATDLRPTHLDSIRQDIISLDELPAAFERLLKGAHSGRTVVKI